MQNSCRIDTSSTMSRVGMETYRVYILPHCWVLSSMYCFCIWKCSNSIKSRSTLSNRRYSSNYTQCKFYKDINNNRILLHWIKAQRHKILESIIPHKLCHFTRTIRFSTLGTFNCPRFHTQYMDINNQCKSSFEILDNTRSYNSMCNSELIQLHSSLMRITKYNCCLPASKEMSKMNM